MDWISAGAGILGGLFGGSQQPELTDEQRRIYELLLKQYYQQMRFAKSVPLSQPQEQAALAQDRGLAGRELSNQRERIYAAMGPNDAGNAGDALSNLAQSEVGTLGNIDTQHLFNSLGRRDAARQGALGILGQAGGIAGQGSMPQPSPFAGALGQLAQAYAYSQHRQGPATPPISPASVRPISGVTSNNAAPSPTGWDGLRNRLDSDLWAR